MITLATSTVAPTGKGKYGDRATGAVCYPLNADKVNEHIVRMYTALYGSDPNDASDYPTIQPGEWVAMRVKDIGLPDREYIHQPDQSVWALICTEGVGYTPDDYRIIPFYFHGRGYSGQYRVHIHNDMVDEFIDEDGPTIDLADHVRTFGDRLESNFGLWFSRKFEGGDASE